MQSETRYSNNRKLKMLQQMYYIILPLYYWIVIYYGVKTLATGDANEEPYVKECVTGSWKFISIWTHILQQCLFYLWIVHNFASDKYITSKQRHRLRWTCSYLYFSMVFPLSSFVSAMFWTLYGYNRDLIYPRMFDTAVPKIINHACHTTPFPILIIQLLLMPNLRPTLNSALLGLNGLIGVYLFMIIQLYRRDGKWIYVVFNHSSQLQIVTILVLSYTFIIICTLLGLKLHVFIHQKILRQRKKGNIKDR